MKKLIILFVLGFSIFSCMSKDGKKFLDKFKENSEIKYKLEEEIEAISGIPVRVNLKDSIYGINGQIKDEEKIIVTLETKIKPSVADEIVLVVKPTDKAKAKLMSEKKYDKWYSSDMRYIPSKDREISISDSLPYFKLNISEQLLGALFKKIYGNIPEKFKNIVIDINGKKMILDEEYTDYYSKTSKDSLGNLKFRFENEDFREELVQMYRDGTLSKLSDIEIEEVLNKSIRDTIKHCLEMEKKGKTNYHCITNKPKKTLKYYRRAIYFKQEDDKKDPLTKEEMKELVQKALEKINYDIPTHYLFYFCEYRGERVGFYLEDGKVIFITRET